MLSLVGCHCQDLSLRCPRKSAHSKWLRHSLLLISLCTARVCLQITDDSELAMCLLRGLLGAPASSLLPLDAIAHWFAEWLHSPPFDIGIVGMCGSLTYCSWVQSGFRGPRGHGAGRLDLARPCLTTTACGMAVAKQAVSGASST